jgi:TolA-binding protein
MRWRTAASLLALIVASPALGQQDVSKRVDTLEGQMRAVQRKVFPGGNPKYFEPEFPQGQQGSGAATEPPASTSAIADINVRLQALERQIAETTGRQEQIENRARLLEEQFKKFKEDVEFRLNAPTPAPAPAPEAPAAVVPAPAVVPAVPAAVPPKTAVIKPTPTPPSAKPPAPAIATTAPKPVSPSDAPYQAAYAAYQAKRYDDAISMFEDFASRNPKHPLASNALFWQGKAYSAKKQFGLAARSHLRGYDRYREAGKAEDNLLGLADALVAVGRQTQACEALAEFQAVFKTPSSANRAKVDVLRKTAKCS